MLSIDYKIDLTVLNLDKCHLDLPNEDSIKFRLYTNGSIHNHTHTFLSIRGSKEDYISRTNGIDKLQTLIPLFSQGSIYLFYCISPNCLL